MTRVKCDYADERWAILSQLSILVGLIQQAARWASDGEAERAHALAALSGARGEPPPRPRCPSGWEWDFYVGQVHKVVSWIPDLEVRHREWAGRRLVLPTDLGRETPRVFTPCIPIGTPPP